MRVHTRNQYFNKVYEKETRGLRNSKNFWLYDVCYAIFHAGYKLGWAAAKKRYTKNDH